MTIPQFNIRLGSNIRAEYNPSGSANNVSLSDYYRSLTNESNVNSYRTIPANPDSEFEFPPGGAAQVGNFTNSNYARTEKIYRIKPGLDGENTAVVSGYTPRTRTWKWNGEVIKKTVTTTDANFIFDRNESAGPEYKSPENTDQNPDNDANPHPQQGAFHYNVPVLNNMSSGTLTWPPQYINGVINPSFVQYWRISSSYANVQGINNLVLWTEVYALCRVRGAVEYNYTRVNPNVPNLPINSTSISFGNFRGGFN